MMIAKTGKMTAGRRRRRSTNGQHDVSRAHEAQPQKRTNQEPFYFLLTTHRECEGIGVVGSRGVGDVKRGHLQSFGMKGGRNILKRKQEK